MAVSLVLTPCLVLRFLGQVDLRLLELLQDLSSVSLSCCARHRGRHVPAGLGTIPDARQVLYARRGSGTARQCIAATQL